MSNCGWLRWSYEQVNNAGGGAAGPACEFDIEDAKACFDINLFAPMRLTQLVVPSMAKQRSGLIINIGSVVGESVSITDVLR